MWRNLVLTIFAILAISMAQAEAQKKFEPPMRLGVPFPSAWKAMLSVLDSENWKLVKKDRGRGEILTDYQEYMSGPLTAQHLDKIGVRPRLPDGEWVRVRYRYDLSVSLIRERQTTVTVDSDIQALKRDFLGREEWVEIDSVGRVERQLLTAFGQALYGADFSLEKRRKGILGLPPIGEGRAPAKPPGN